MLKTILSISGKPGLYKLVSQEEGERCGCGHRFEESHS